MHNLMINLILVFGFSVNVSAQMNPQESDNTDPNTRTVFEIVDPNVAILAAADYLPAFYPGNWEFFNHLVCYDIDGLPAAYVVIFRDPNSPIKTWEEVTAQVKKASDELDELDRQIAIIQASQETPQEDKDRLIKERTAQKIGTLRKSYLSGDFATVVTGATDQSELLIRCYRGLPSVLVSESDLKKQLLKKHLDLKQAYPTCSFTDGGTDFLGAACCFPPIAT